MTTKSAESATRLTDYRNSLSGNASLAAAVSWLRQHTACDRLTDVEVTEMIKDAVNIGSMTMKWSGTTIP
jgi:hypothetical protein